MSPEFTQQYFLNVSFNIFNVRKISQGKLLEINCVQIEAPVKTVDKTKPNTAVIFMANHWHSIKGVSSCHT